MTLSMKNELISVRGEWWGVLTLENIEAIAERIRSLLTGKRYTWVANNGLFGTLPRPEVRTSQQMDKLYIHYGEDKTWGMISVNDSYGSWSISTSSNPDKVAYLLFEYSKLTIEHYAPGGNKLIWVIAVEQ